MNKYKIILSAFFFLSLSQAFAANHKKPLALVWNGPGACRPSCVLVAVHVAKKAGFKVRYVNPSLTDYSVFKIAKLWVQPGGKSVTAAQSMSTEMHQEIVDFVASGGGYVGFCAGAFISTAKIGTSGEDGYGILPGSTELLVKHGPENLMLKISTPKFGNRWMLYAGGPFMKVSDEELAAVQGEVIARYPDGSIGGIHGRFGKGKVAVVGFHPEADIFWKLFDRKIDRDGSDAFFAVDMIRYATSP